MKGWVFKKSIVKATFAAMAVNVFLLTFKYIAGSLGHSAALRADAFHSFSDFIIDLVVLLFIFISAKPKDDSHKYGHGKFQTIGTAAIGIVLLFVGLALLWNGVEPVWRYFFRGERIESPGMIAFWAALVAAGMKEFIFRYSIRAGKREKSSVVIANGWHHRADALVSAGTALGVGGAIILGPDWNILDPLAAIAVSIIITRTAIGLICPAFKELTESALPKEVEEEIMTIIESVPEVKQPHDLCTRMIGGKYAIEAHVCVRKDYTVDEAHQFTQDIEKKLEARFGELAHVNLHIEPVLATLLARESVTK